MSQNGSGKKFDRDEYRRRKAQRDQSRPAQWVTNPETESEFCLRKVGALAFAISGAMPSSLTNKAIEAWEKQGLDIAQSPQVSVETLAQRQRNIDLYFAVIRDACVEPKIVIGATAPDEIDPIELDDSDVLFIFEWATGQRGTLPMKGGAEVRAEDLQTFPERPSESTGISTSEPELQPAA